MKDEEYKQVETTLRRARKTIFLDRDGTINRRAPEHEYITRPEQLILLDGAGEGIRLLNDCGFRICIVTNQRGIARGLLSEERLREIHIKLLSDLKVYGANIDNIYFCPHERGACSCRKPQVGLFLQAERDEPIDKVHSYMVGDSRSDMEAGKGYGIQTVYLGNKNVFGADICAVHLVEVAERILEQEDECIDHRGSRIYRQPL